MNEEEFKELPLLLKVSDIQKILGIGRNSAYELIYRKQFPVLRLGERQIRVPKNKFVEWIKNNTKTYEFIS